MEMTELFQSFAKQEHWSPEKQIEILLEFIEEKDKNDELVDFLEDWIKDYHELRR